MSLKDYSPEELQGELNRRGEISDIPKPLDEEDMNFTELKELCRNYLETIASGELEDAEDMKNYVFELAISSIYGRSIWDYIGSKTA